MIALDVVFFATADARWTNVIDAYVDGAAYHFASFDLALSSYPARPADPTPLPLVGAVYDRVPDNGIGLLAGTFAWPRVSLCPRAVGYPLSFAGSSAVRTPRSQFCEGTSESTAASTGSLTF
jgi:hypothetical protein